MRAILLKDEDNSEWPLAIAMMSENYGWLKSWQNAHRLLSNTGIEGQIAS